LSINVVVCLKQVPGTTVVKIDPDTGTLIRHGIESITNPFDTYALEEGVRIKERLGGQVVAVSMGPPQAEEMLHQAIAGGADKAVLLSDAAFAGSDTWATAYALVGAVKKLGNYQLIVCGRQTLDGDTGQVGPELAEMLGLPLIAYVSCIEYIDEKHLRVRRLTEEGYEVIEAPLPAVITVTKEINEPRLPSLRGMMRAKTAAITIWTADELDIAKALIGLSGSATRVTKVFFPERTRQGEMLSGSVNEMVEGLVTRLRDGGHI